MRSRDGGKSWFALKGPCAQNDPTIPRFPFPEHFFGLGHLPGGDPKSGATRSLLFRTEDGDDSWEKLDVTHRPLFQEANLEHRAGCPILPMDGCASVL